MPQAPELEVRPDGLHLAITADPVSIRDGLARMLAVPPLALMKPDARSMAELVLAEVLNNVAEHAYAERTGTVEITLVKVAGGLSCLIVDHGVAMPGGALPKGSLPGKRSTLPEDLPEGGFGWHLIRKLTRSLDYSRIGNENRLNFTLSTAD